MEEYDIKQLELNKEDRIFIQEKINEGNIDKKIGIKINEKDNFEIRSKQYVGVIKLPSGKRIRIIPKIGNVKLLQVWNYVELGNLLDYENLKRTQMEKGREYLDILAYIFNEEVKGILRKGLYKCYIDREEKKEFMRGKIDLKKQINSPLQNKFYLEYEEISKDNKINQLVLTALKILTSIVKNEKLNKNLKKQYDRIRKEIDYRGISIGGLEQIHLNTLSSYYERAIIIAKIIVRSTYFETTKYGEIPSFSFLINMNTLFERFVRKLLQDNYPNKTIKKETQSLEKSNEIDIKPDLVVKEGKDLEIVGDVKYKKEKVSSSDYYQSIAYGLANNRDSFLIHEGKGKVETYELRHTDRLVYRIPFDLESISRKNYIDKARENLKNQVKQVF